LELIKIIQTVKSQTTLPVTTAEDWETWKENPHLVKEVDYILAHVHPYWRGIEPENAALHVLKVWQHLTEIFPGKKVVIGETGWPSQGDANGKAVASPENQSRFLAQFLQLAEKYQIEYFYFDLFDESFKVNVEGPCGGHWGLFYEDGSLKPANRFIFPADAEVKISRPAKVVTITSASLPLNVYTEGGDEKNAFCPSGWMGDYNNIVLDPACTTNPHSGQTCTKIVYRQGSQGWGGIYWQYPIQNRGEYPGYSVKGAKAVTFWARGEKGGEKSIFKIGGINESQFKFRDSFGPLATGTLKLTQDWQKLEIDLSKADTSSLIGGFCWVTTSFSDSITIFLDDIVIN